jgi:hypothetical protein
MPITPKTGSLFHAETHWRRDFNLKREQNPRYRHDNGLINPLKDNILGRLDDFLSGWQRRAPLATRSKFLFLSHVLLR